MSRPAADEIWRRTLEANLRYYDALGRLTVDYVRALTGVLGEVRLPVRLGERGKAMTVAPPAPPVPRAASPAAPPALVLETTAAAPGVGAFMVENHFTHDVSAPITARAFVDDAGASASPQLRFDPGVVALGPGEQMLVRVTALADETLEEGASYRGEVSVEGLTGAPVPIVIRRAEEP